MTVHAEQLTVLGQRQHVGIRIDARLVELVQTDQLVADLVGRIAEHQHDLFSAFGDAAQADRKAVAGQDREDHADRLATELFPHIGRDVVHGSIVALRARNDRFCHRDHVTISQAKAVALCSSKHTVGNDRRQVVSLPNDRAADAARHSPDASGSFHKKSPSDGPAVFFTGFFGQFSPNPPIL